MNVERIEATPAVEPADPRVRHLTRGFTLVWPRSRRLRRRRHSTQLAQHSKSRGYASHNRTVDAPVTQPTIDELLDRAVQAINRGDRATADALAGQVLAVDRSNPDAEELLAAPEDSGEIRRLTILFTDLVDSTALSTRIEPEIYRTVVGRYRQQVHEVVDRYEGHIGSTQGDGLLAVFGHPKAHENDVRRAVQAGLDITRQVSRLSERVQSRFGFKISVRVGIHRGLVYLDTAHDDVFGFGANLAARICELAEPGAVAISDTVERLVRDAFELEALPPKTVKGVEGLIAHYRVVVRTRRHNKHARTAGSAGSVSSPPSRRSWAEATAGTLAMPGIAFQGEGGIGKTRLAYAAVDMAQQAGAVVLGLFGSPFHTDVGLRPVRRMLEGRCGITARIGCGGPHSQAGGRGPEALIGSGRGRPAVGARPRHRSRERL